VSKIDLSGARPSIQPIYKIPADTVESNPISNIFLAHDHRVEIDRLSSVIFLKETGQFLAEIPVKPQSMTDVYYFPKLEKCLHNGIKVPMPSLAPTKPVAHSFVLGNLLGDCDEQPASTCVHNKPIYPRHRCRVYR